MKTNSEAFIDALGEIDGGLFLQQIGDDLAALVKACSAQGKKGGISITLGLKPNSRGQVEVVAGVECRMPKGDKFAAIFFGTEDGRLQRRDPRQPDLPGWERSSGEEAGGGAEEVRSAMRAAVAAKLGAKVVPMDSGCA